MNRLKIPAPGLSGRTRTRRHATAMSIAWPLAVFLLSVFEHHTSGPRAAMFGTPPWCAFWILSAVVYVSLVTRLKTRLVVGMTTYGLAWGILMTQYPASRWTIVWCAIVGAGTGLVADLFGTWPRGRRRSIAKAKFSPDTGPRLDVGQERQAVDGGFPSACHSVDGSGVFND